MFQIAKLLGNAFLRAATASVAINGFRTCGLFPINRHVFNDHEFAPSTVRPMENEELLENVNGRPNEYVTSTDKSVIEETRSKQAQEQHVRTEGASTPFVSPHIIDPIPKAVTIQKRKYKRRIPPLTVITNLKYRTLLSENTEKKTKEKNVIKSQVKRKSG